MAGSVYPFIFGHSCQLSLNKLFDPSTSSMRKGHNGGKKGAGGGIKKTMMLLVATNIIDS